MNKYKLGVKGSALITEFESLVLDSYLDAVGVWTIGFGSTRLNGSLVTKGMTINEAVAWALFHGDCQAIVDFVAKAIIVPLNQNQVDAVVSLAYNIGKAGLLNSTLLTSINHKLIINEDLFTRWNKGRVNGELKVLDGLTRRRKAEYQLYMSKEGL